MLIDDFGQQGLGLKAASDIKVIYIFILLHAYIYLFGDMG